MKTPREVGRRSRLLAAGSMMAAVVLVLAACGGGAGGTTGGAEGPQGEPKRGGVLVMTTSDNPRGMAPTALQNVAALSAQMGNAIYGTLVTNDPETGELEPGLAESLESSDGGKNWTLKLRQEVQFSDGTPFTAEAVKANWEMHADPANGSSFISTASLVVDYTVVDEKTLQFTLAEALPYFGVNLSTQALNWIASPAALAEGPESFNANPIGAGPFVLKRWRQGAEIELERNDNYYDAPRPYLDGVVLRLVPDPAQAVDSLIAGDVHAALATDSPVDLERAKQAGMQVNEHQISGGQNLMFNNQKPPFDDVRARSAVSMAVDLEALNAAVYQGKGDIVTTFFDESDPMYSDVPLHEYDPDGAQELFDELAADGKPLEFTIRAAYAGEIAEAIQTQLATYDNVTVNIEQTEPSEATSMFMQGNYQATLNGIQVVVPEMVMETWLSKNSTFHAGVILDDDLTGLVSKARGISDADERVEIWKQIQEKMAELDPYLFTTRSVVSMVLSPDVGGVEQIGLGGVKMDQVWLDQ